MFGVPISTCLAATPAIKSVSVPISDDDGSASIVSVENVILDTLVSRALPGL